MKYHYKLIKMLRMKKAGNIKHWQGCRANGIPYALLVGCSMLQHLCKIQDYTNSPAASRMKSIVDFLGYPSPCHFLSLPDSPHLLPPLTHEPLIGPCGD